MSQNLSSETKRWVSATQSNQFMKVQREIQNYQFDNETSKSKSMLRLLIYLCQTATKCPPTDHQSGCEISELCKTICNNLTSISSTSNYFSSLYHIIRVLLEMELFEEAMSICNNLLPSSKWHQQMKHEGELLNDNYSKLWSIFHVSIDKFLRSKKSESITQPIFHQILTVIKYQLKLEELTKTDGSKTLLLKLLHYTELLQSIHCTKEEFDEFTNKFFLKYLNSIKLTLGERNRTATYQNFTKIITSVSIYYIKNRRFEKSHKILEKLLRNFESCMLENRESSKCHQLCKEFIKTFIKPSNDYIKEDSEKINDLIEQFQTQILSYGEDSLVKYTIYSTASILEALSTLWTKSLPAEVIIASTELLNYISEIIRKYQLDTLCSCGNKSCLVLQDKNKSAQLKTTFLHLLQRLCPNSPLPAFYEQFTLISAQCVDILHDLQEKKCDKWKNLWLITAPTIYNFASNFKDHQKQTVYLCTFLATSIIRLKANHDEKVFFFQNNPTPPLSLVLHRLSNRYYLNHQYYEARIFTAIKIYLYPDQLDGKGYRNWSLIHYQDPTSRGLTLVEFLRKHSHDMKVLGLEEFKLKNDVLRNICLREIKSHIEMKIDMSESIIAVLHCLESLNIDDITYVTAVHQLGYHCLNFQSKAASIYKYLKNATSRLKSSKVKGANFEYSQYLISHLTLYEAVEEIRELEEATTNEMKSTNIKLHAVSSNNGVSTKGSDVVPAFSQINITTAKTLSSRLDNIYNLWKKLLAVDSIEKWNLADGTSTVKAVILAGEYSRFYRDKNLEIKFWKMGYDLAVKSDNYQWIVYVTGRAIVSRYIRNDWITKSEDIIFTKLNNSKEPRVLGIISMFKMSLSDYYYYIGRTKEADALFDEGKKITTLELGENSGTFVFSQYLLLTHRFHNFPPEKKNDLEYTGILAHTLYAMLVIDDLVIDSKDVTWSLYEMDMLMKVSCNISPRMNALYSFREITAHLARRLKVCQSKISVLRVAEILKYLCIIDLSRNQLEDCEVKLQGLEHILQIEMFENSMQREIIKVPDSCLFSTAVSPDRTLMDPIRDIPQNDSSPILRRETFTPPDFMTHEQKCKCFRCVNEAYKFLVFSCTHIRAQLYTLQNLKHYARQHFEGALNISENLLNLLGKEDNHYHYYLIDYVLFLLDYVRFLKNDPNTYEEGRRIVCWALETCDINRLECNPVCMSSMEIVFEYRFDKFFPEENTLLPKSSLVIPGVDEIDISEYTDPQLDTPESLCLTPAKESGNSPRPRSRSPRRKNNHSLLSLSKASVDVVESDPEDLSPAVMVPDKPNKRQLTRVKPVRRRLAEDDDFDEDEETSSTRKSSPANKHEDLDIRVINLIDEAIVVAPDLSRKLHVLRRIQSKGPITDKVLQKLIDILEDGNAEYEKPKSRSRARRALGNAEPSIIDVCKVKEIIQTVKLMMPVETTPSGTNKASTSTSAIKRSDSSLASLTKGIEGLSVRTSGALSIPEIEINDGERVDSDDEVVESSIIIQPRRSRRLVGKNTTSETKISHKRL